MMTLNDLNNMLCGNPDRCFMLFDDEDCSHKIDEVWTSNL